MTANSASAPRLYGLLFIAKYKESHANLAKVKDPVDVYLLCAALCAASVTASGGKFALVTNDRGRLLDRCAALGIEDLDVIEHQFKWPVPEGIPFYSAHFKLEVLEAFGTGEFGERPALIDVDTVLWKPLDLPALGANSIIAYDITRSQIPSSELPHMRNDLELAAGRTLRNPRWYGGEFLMGGAAVFQTLSAEIKKCWPHYLKAIDRLRHVGDETVVSAALNLASEAGDLTLIDADRDGGVVRWWTSRLTFPVVETFKQIENRSLLHVPSDKDFLAKYPAGDFSGSRFVAAYRKHAARKLLVRRVFNDLSKPLGRQKKFVPRLG